MCILQKKLLLRYFIRISFLGKEYCGWQIQPGQISVQETIEKCIGNLIKEKINIVDHLIRSTLKENEIINIEKHKFLITHIAGICPNYNKKVKKLISDEKPNILIYGHSHLLKVEFDKKNQLTAINPGAAGKHGFHNKRTMIRFKISKSGLSDMEIIELGERGKLS